ncbi:hypothetical protein GOODEAATRI_034552 [Goodea atripinnis]|uniref:Uncharacterized protein n=1 Tax=Goodea atripinnis TaxID=208336 RepID=A0ABV0MN15_9TELE
MRDTDWLRRHQVGGFSTHRVNQQQEKNMTMEGSLVNSKTEFESWKYRQYFTFAEVKGKNVPLTCPGTKKLSTSVTSNSNLMKHLASSHLSITLVANNPSPAAASASSDNPIPCKKKRLDFSGQKLVT